MPRGEDVMVTKDGKRWRVKSENASRSAGVFDTQREAIERGRELAKNKKVDLIVQGEDGKIRSKDSYGNDPHPPKG